MACRRVKICVLGEEDVVNEFLESLGGKVVAVIPPIKRLTRNGTEYYLWGCRNQLHLHDASGLICVVDPDNYYRSKDYLSMVPYYEDALETFLYSIRPSSGKTTLIEHTLQRDGTPFSLGDLTTVKQWIYNTTPVLTHPQMLIPKQLERHWCCLQ